MEETRLTRTEIERPDFPRSADGYDREAVDRHLRRVAELLAQPDDAEASWKLSIAMAAEVRSIGESAAARVEEIVGVAERSAAEIVRRAEQQAAATLEGAEESATTIRRQALEDAARAAEEAEREALAAQKRAEAQAAELREAIATASALLERLGSASTLARDFQAISERMGAAQAPQVGPDDEESEPAGDEEEDEKPRPVSVWFSRLGGGHDDEQVDEAIDADPSASTAGEGEAAIDEGAAPADEHTSKRNPEPQRSNKMRMTAFNMLVAGSKREEVAQHLRESFELTDEDDDLLETTLEEAAGRTADWRAIPNPIPRRRRFLGR